MTADTVLAIFHHERLPDALAALHRSGYGTNTRVMDAARGDRVRQLQRAGVGNPPALGDPPLPVVMVVAPGRVAAVVDILQQTGARAIHLAERSAEAQPASPFGFSSSTLLPARQTAHSSNHADRVDPS
jgi:hypothetical protein